jgi:hypothetical protein
MENTMWHLFAILACVIVSVFAGNYTYYDGNRRTRKLLRVLSFKSCGCLMSFSRLGFAHRVNNQTLANQTITTCVCQCLLREGCAVLTFYNQTQSCSLVYDTVITENDISMNNTARLILVSANISYAP